MSNKGDAYDSVENVLAKLYVLRDSCTGVIHKEGASSNLIWFQGAQVMLQEAVDGLQKTLGTLEEGSA
ncbi:MAG: hypothetical protein KJP05_10355 [Deltaproteobacteria bacterium]|nr:hypothetical protein [Deltaproteobacteria bacterium]